MFILITLVILLACCWVTESRRRARLKRARTPQVSEPFQDVAPASSSSQSGLTWSALDDVQLTRLLTDAARHTNTE